MTINHQRVFRGFSSSEILEEFSEVSATNEESHQDILDRELIDVQSKVENIPEDSKGWK